MESIDMRVSDIIHFQEKARKENKIPARSKACDPEEFKRIFNEKCEELKDGRKAAIQE